MHCIKQVFYQSGVKILSALQDHMRKRKDSVYTSAFIFPSLVHLLERKLSQGQPRFWEARAGSLGSNPIASTQEEFLMRLPLTPSDSGCRNHCSCWTLGPSPKEENNEMVTPLHPKCRINLWFNMKSTSEIFLSNSC